MDLIKSINEMADVENGPEISIKHEGIGRGYTAVDTNTYDGAEDGHNYVGYGSNNYAAVEDLINQLEAAKMYSSEILNQTLEDYHVSAQADMEDERTLGIQDEEPRVDYQ